MLVKIPKFNFTNSDIANRFLSVIAYAVFYVVALCLIAGIIAFIAFIVSLFG